MDTGTQKATPYRKDFWESRDVISRIMVIMCCLGEIPDEKGVETLKRTSKFFHCLIDNRYMIFLRTSQEYIKLTKADRFTVCVLNIRKENGQLTVHSLKHLAERWLDYTFTLKLHSGFVKFTMDLNSESEFCLKLQKNSEDISIKILKPNPESSPIREMYPFDFGKYMDNVQTFPLERCVPVRMGEMMVINIDSIPRCVIQFQHSSAFKQIVRFEHEVILNAFGIALEADDFKDAYQKAETAIRQKGIGNPFEFEMS